MAQLVRGGLRPAAGPGGLTSPDTGHRTREWSRIMAKSTRLSCRSKSKRMRSSLHGAAPLKPLPEPVDLEQYRIRRRACVAGLINEYHLVA
jgi:hypothetical protein